MIELTVRSLIEVKSVSVHILITAVLKELTMLKWKAMAVAVASVVAVGGVGVFASQRGDAENPPPKVAVEKPKESLVPGVDIPLAEAPPVKIGDFLRIEVLEALPGRPITGQRIVRPDGKISLDFYGEVYVFGLNRKQIKAKVVQHLRKYIKDDVLGLIEGDPDDPTGTKMKPVAPEDNPMVSVEEVSEEEWRRDASKDKLDKILDALNDLRVQSHQSLTFQKKATEKARTEKAKAENQPEESSASTATDTTARLDVYERRLSEVEQRLDRVLKSLESAIKKP